MPKRKRDAIESESDQDSDTSNESSSDAHEDVSCLLDRLPPLFTISCASKRNSGKTVLISQLIQMLLKEKRVDMVLVMSGSAGLNHDWEFLPKELVMPYSEATLGRLWQRQKDTPKDEETACFWVLMIAWQPPTQFVVSC